MRFDEVLRLWREGPERAFVRREWVSGTGPMHCTGAIAVTFGSDPRLKPVMHVLCRNMPELTCDSVETADIMADDWEVIPQCILETLKGLVGTPGPEREGVKPILGSVTISGPCTWSGSVTPAGGQGTDSTGRRI